MRRRTASPIGPRRRTPLRRRRGKAAALVAAVVLGVTVAGRALAGLPPGGTFGDDDGNVHEGAIEAIAAEGITLGCNPPLNDRYCPDRAVTRGEMAAFLVRALGLIDRGGAGFTDDDGTPFEADIERLAAAGVTRGCNPPANDRYCPDRAVTRGEMAAFLVRAFGFSEGGGEDHFADDDGSIFENDIDRLAAAGVTRGCNPPDDDRYCPGDAVLRDQMASFLARALGLSPITPPPPATTTTIPPAPRMEWSCADYGAGYWSCRGDIDPGDASLEIWSCADHGSSWNCNGDVDKQGILSESWTCTGGGGAWACSGEVDRSGALTESWSCSGSGTSWDCRGNVDKRDGAAESWGCVADGATWDCLGDVDKGDAGAEWWSCTATGTSWDCRGDEPGTIAVVSPVPIPTRGAP